MKQIYKYLLAGALVCCVAISAMAQSAITTNGVKVQNIVTEPHDERMSVDMILDISDLHIRSNYSLLITPIITNGREMVQLPPVVIDGRRRSIVHQRQQSEMYESIKTFVRRYNKKEQVVEYDADIPLEPWMRDSELIFREEWCSCHDVPLSEELMAIATIAEPTSDDASSANLPSDKPSDGELTPTSVAESQPRMAYVMPTTDGDVGVQGEIDIYFAVNKSEVNPSLMGNATEIEDVKTALSHAGVSKISLVGYASPEGPYEFNSALAARRAEAVKEYLTSHNMGDNLEITTTSSPANWDEVKRLLSDTFIENWRGIVSIIDDPAIAPADKNNAIRVKYPVEYDFMLSNWYPKLRVTEIAIEQEHPRRSIEQVKNMMQSAPSQLSLEDIYMVALTYDKGSKEWDEIIIFAVERFPQSAQARINAANVAMANGDYDSAAQYLQGLPSTMPEALNSRGILAMAQGNYSEAMMLFQQAERDGVSEATYNISLLKELINASAQ